MFEIRRQFINMNIKVVWALALISVCIVLVAADDNNDDNGNSNTRFIKWKKRYRRTRRTTTTTAPEVNENVDGGINVNIKVDDDASVDNNPPTYTIKKRYSKTKAGYAGVATDDGDVHSIKIKKRVVKRKRVRTTTTAPEVNENVEGGINVNIKVDDDASVDNNPPTYTIKKRYSKTKASYAGVATDGGDVQSIKIKKRVVKRKRVKAYVNTEETSTHSQSDDQVVVPIKKKRPVIKRKRVVKPVYVNSGYSQPTTTGNEQTDIGVDVSVNKRPIYKRKGFLAGIYENDDSTTGAPYTKGPAIIKKKNLRISVENNNDEELDDPKPVVIKQIKQKRTSISIDDDGADGEVQQNTVVVNKNKYKLNIKEDLDDPRPVRINKFKQKRTSISIDADGADGEVQQRPVVVGKNKYKLYINEDLDDPRPVVINKIKRKRTTISIDADGADGEVQQKQVFLGKNKYKYVDYDHETGDNTDYLPQKPIRVYKRKHVEVKAVPKVVKSNVDVNYAIDETVSLSTKGSTPKKVVPLFAGAPAPTVKVEVGGTPAKLLEGPIRQAEITDKAMKAIIKIVTDTAAKNTKIVENRIANLFNFGVDNIGGAVADVQAIKLNNNRAVRDIILTLSSSVDKSFDLTVDGVGGVIRNVGFGTTGQSIFKNTVDCINGTLKNILWTKLNVLEYMYIIKTQFLTFGLQKPISVLPKVASKLGVCLKIVKI